MATGQKKIVGRGRKKGTPKTGGRKKGTPNHITTQVRNAIIEAFERAGGVDYLKRVADEEPKVFLQLLGKVLPKQVDVDHKGQVDNRIEVSVRYVSASEN